MQHGIYLCSLALLGVFLLHNVLYRGNTEEIPKRFSSSIIRRELPSSTVISYVIDKSVTEYIIDCDYIYMSFRNRNIRTKSALGKIDNNIAFLFNTTSETTIKYQTPGDLCRF